MSGLYADAVLRLLPTSEGGLGTPVRSGTRSLLLNFVTPQGEVQLGAMIELSDVSEIAPGEEASVKLHFWAEEARVTATRGVTFRAWHGRPVGDGRILQLHDYEFEGP